MLFIRVTFLGWQKNINEMEFAIGYQVKGTFKCSTILQQNYLKYNISRYLEDSIIFENKFNTSAR